MLFMGNIYSQISKDSAFIIVQKTLLLEDNYSSKNIYVHKNIISPLDTLKTFYNEIITPNYYSWFFFIDDIPLANWGHDCRYVFVDSQTGYLTIQNANLPPSLGNMDVLHEITIEYQDTIYYQSKSLKSIESSNGNNDSDNDICLSGNTYAVIISGGMDQYNNHVRYWNDCAFIYSTLINKYSFDKEKVYILMADGTSAAIDRHLLNGTYDSSPLDLDGDGSNDIQYAATKNNISSVFNTLANIITSNDNVFVFTTDHGGSGSSLILWGEVMTGTEFATEINKINTAESINIVMEQCYSGGYISALAGNNRVISTACSATELSYSMSNLLYDEFVYHWTSAINKSRPDGFVVNADANNDGKISMTEAFQYASSADTKE
jgi:hypothetical protein